MIFPKTTDDEIIHILSEHKKTTISDLQAMITEDTSLPNLYKKIKQLLDKHIIAKEGKYIFLNKKWIISYLNLAETIKNTHHVIENYSLPKNFSHKKYTAQSLYQLDTIRSSLLSEINIFYNHSKTNYIYNDHTYHIIGMEELESNLFNIIGKTTSETEFLIGNNAPLDQYGVTKLNYIPGTTAIHGEKIGNRSGYMINIVGDYYIEVIMPKIIYEYFEVIFQNTKDIKNLDKEMFENIFHIKENHTLTIYHNPKQAETMRSYIQKEYSKKKWREL